MFRAIDEHRGLRIGVVFVALVGLLVGSAGRAAGAPDQPTHILTGTWERLPDIPDVSNLSISDATPLADGRIALTLCENNETHGSCVAVYSPDSSTWDKPALDPADACFGSDSDFELGPDGRLLDLIRVIDPSVEPWTVEPAPWAPPEYLAGPAVTSDGSAYLFENYLDGSDQRTRALALDLATGATQPRASVDDNFQRVISGSVDRIFVAGGIGQPPPLAIYDPAADAWSVEQVPAALRWVRWETAAVGVGGWIFVFNSHPELTGAVLYARNPDSGEWLIVEPPPGVGDRWFPDFVGGDGVVYAMDRLQPYVFTPGDIVPIPTPEPAPSDGGFGGTVPDTAASPSSSPIAAVIAVAFVVGLALAAVAGLRSRGRSRSAT